MINLERVLVTQFYLYEAQAVELEEITGMFGPNGSGKSSFIDAVQIAMTGGNKNFIALNAQADDAKKGVARTIRSYCLGQHGEMPNQRARNEARTYISLVWRNSVTNEPLSMGICIYAYADREKEEIRGRYVAPGLELTLSDHLERTDRGDVSRDWEAFRHQIRERVERINGRGHDPIFVDSDRFVRAMLLALRGAGGVPESSLFLRAFRFALRMKFDKAVDSIVREDVLEPNDTKIDKFKEVTESFRLLKEQVEQVELKIIAGQRVIAEYDKASAAAAREQAWKTISSKVEVEIVSDQLDERLAAKSAAETELKRCTDAAAALGRQIEKLQGDLRDVKMLREGHHAHKDFASLQAAVSGGTTTAREKAVSLTTNLSFIRRTMEAAAISTWLELYAKALKEAAQSIQNLEANVQSVDTEAVTASLRPALTAIKTAVNTLIKERMDIGPKLRDAQEKHDRAKDGLERAKLGKPPLQDKVRDLKSALERHGLNPQPVCDVVRVSLKYKTWQPVIEAYLSSNRVQALMLPDGEEREAFGIYRAIPQRNDVTGVKLVMERRQPIGRIATPGSVAELLEGDHPAALAYLQRQFGDLQRADSDADALSGKRTLTVDGMLVSGGEIDRLKLPDLAQCRIGIESREHLRSAMAQFETCEADLRKVKTTDTDLQDVLSSLMALPSGDAALLFVTEAFADMKKAQRDAELARRQMQSAGNDEYVVLGAREDKLDEELVSLLRQQNDASVAKGCAVNALESRVSEERHARERLQILIAAAAKVQQAAGDDRAFELHQWDIMLEKFDLRYTEMLQHSRTQEDLTHRRLGESIRAGDFEFHSFQTKYRESFDSAVAEDWRKTHEWIAALVYRLKSTQLVEFKEQMNDAYRTSQETFRNDVALALKERLDFLEYRINELNKVLDSCPAFSNGERYKFSAVIRPRLGNLLKFVKDIATHGPDGDLWNDPATLPPEFADLLNDKVATGAAGARSPLEDYREFYDFDVDILRDDPVTRVRKLVGHLSKRIGPGSGGEHRAPLYVIGGAALASAYRLNSTIPNGLRLMVIDEAFNKMDPTNITATMRYLEDLGLQLFMASPGENQGTLNAFLHRYYDVTRDAENSTVMLEGHSLSESVRELHRADLPEFNPALIEEELELMRRERIVSATT